MQRSMEKKKKKKEACTLPPSKAILGSRTRREGDCHPPGQISDKVVVIPHLPSHAAKSNAMKTE
jgi:hypothetical protein